MKKMHEPRKSRISHLYRIMEHAQFTKCPTGKPGLQRRMNISACWACLFHGLQLHKSHIHTLTHIGDCKCLWPKVRELKMYGALCVRLGSDAPRLSRTAFLCYTDPDHGYSNTTSGVCVCVCMHMWSPELLIWLNRMNYNQLSKRAILHQILPAR